jgi:hypothetical protein
MVDFRMFHCVFVFMFHKMAYHHGDIHLQNNICLRQLFRFINNSYSFYRKIVTIIDAAHVIHSFIMHSSNPYKAWYQLDIELAIG